MKKTDKSRLIPLTTPYEEEQRGTPFTEYPRPMLVRDSYICLNGSWSFAIERKGERVFDGEITVPFVPESRLSGVECEIEKDDIMVYSRRFTLDPGFNIGRVILHIGACDQSAEVYINAERVGGQEGGYHSFSYDITDHLCLGENALTVRARDPLDRDLPYGKQTEKPSGMWYTKISGIWQTVWLESVPKQYIERIDCLTDLEGVTLTVRGGEREKTLIFEGKEYSFEGDTFRLEVACPKLWTPEEPNLYYFEIRSGSDSVRSYFGLRTVDIRKIKGTPLICLNGQPYFFNGLLDQGYYSDGIFSPASAKGFEDDILRMKECGFNMLRKHIKVEWELFYYYCDKYGMAVFQDMVNSGRYSFLIDTALPTVFLKKGISHSASRRRREIFEREASRTVDMLRSHPSVLYYTVFNEGWGQYDADRVYGRLKEYDPTRVWDATSGWFEGRESDVSSKHIYFKVIKLKKESERPLVLSEFGGYSCRIEGHFANPSKNYGYRLFEKREELERALAELYEKEISRAIEVGLSASVLTQVSDVEDETNGLLTYDRRVIKVDPARMKSVMEKLKRKFAALYLEKGAPEAQCGGK